MAIGRISGPLLKEDLLRDEVNLAFETNLLFLDVNTHAADVASYPMDSTLWTGNIGIRNTNPAFPLDVTGTFRATNIKGGLLEIDNINVNGNTITTSVGSLILDTATNSDKVIINSNVLINGDLHATGSITADGSLTLGDANTDNVVFAADINSDIFPNITDTYNLGGTSKRWNKAHLAIAEIGDVYISSSTVTSSLTNGNINLNSNGTGSVVINNALTVGPTGAIAMPGNISIGGNLTVIGDIIGGPLRTDDIQIVGNRIETTSSNSNFEINTEGTGSIELLANSNVTGTFGVNGLSTLAQAQVTDLTSGRVTFAGANGRLVDSGNLTFSGTLLTVTGSATVTSLATLAQAQVTDLTSGRVTFAGASGRLVDSGNLTFGGSILTVTGDETVTGTATLGNLQVDGTTILTGPVTANNNVNIAGTLFVTGDIVGGPLRTDDIQIVGNRIETTATNSNFEINTVGTGSIELLANTNVTGNLNVSGNIDVVGDITLGGNIRIGDTTLDTVTVIADFTSNLVPDVANTFDLGTSAKPWRVVHAAEFNNGVIRIDDNTITTTVSNADLDLRANGTGNILLANHVTVEGVTSTGATGTGQFVFDTTPTISGATLTNHVTVEGVTSTGATGTENIVFSASPTITGTLTIAGNETITGTITTNDLLVNNNATVNGTLYVTGDIVGGPLRTDDIQIVGNRIETTSSNSNFEINTVGSGTIELLANSNVTGTFGVSGLSTLAQAQITDLTSGRVTFAGASGRLVDSGNLTFSGTLLTVTGNETVTGLATLAQAQVTDLTSGRVTFAGASGRLQDSSALTFSNGTLTVGTSVVVSGTGGDITMTGGNITGVGNISTVGLSVSNNATISGTLYVTGDIVGGPLRTDDIQIVGNRIETTSSNSNFEINTAGTGSIELLANSNVTGTFGVSGLSTLAQAQVTDLTSGRVTLAGANGRLVDSGNLTFSGSTLTVTGDETVTGTATLGILNVNGSTTLIGPVSASNDVSIAGTLYVTGDIVGGPLRTDDIQIVGNRIETTATNSNFEVNTAGTGSIELLADTNVTGNLSVSGNVDVVGNITLGGNIRIGDTTLDTVTVIADFTSDLVPDVANTFDLGTSAKQWRVVNAAEFNNNVIRIDDNSIKTTVSNANLELNANGAGSVELQTNTNVTGNLNVSGETASGTVNPLNLNQNRVTFYDGSQLTDSENLQYDGSTLTVTGNETVTGTITTNNLTVNDNATVSGTLYVTGDIVGGPLRTDDIQIVGNRIETTSSNSNFEINTAGTGSIELLANSNVTGTFGVSGLSTLAQAQVTDLTSGRITYAGTSGRLIDSTNLTFSGSTLTVTGNETVTGTATLGSLLVNGFTTLTGPVLANDTLSVSGTLYVTGDIVGGPLRTDDIQIVGNRIETTSSNSNFEINTAGTGSIELLAATNVTGNLNVSGNIDVVGDITLGGNIRIGDTTLDNVTVVADFTSDLIPNASNSYDLGTANKSWRNVYAGQIDVDGIRIDTTTISTVNSNANLELTPSGTGIVYINGTGAIRIPTGDTSQRPVTGESGFIRFNNQTNNIEAWNGVTFAGISGGSSSDTNGDTLITFETGGNNEDIIKFFTGVAGTTAGSSIGSVEQVQISSTGLNVIRNLTVGNDFTVTGNATISEITTDDVRISGNRISTTQSNSNLELTANGAGFVLVQDTLNVTENLSVTGTSTLTSAVIDNVTVNNDLTVTGNATISEITTDDVRISGNRISTTQSNSNLELTANGTGSVLVQDTLSVAEDLSVVGTSTLARANVSDLTDGRITYAGASGRLKDSANLTFNGTTLAVTGNETISGSLTVGSVTVSGAGSFNSVAVTDLLVNGRIHIYDNVIENTLTNDDLIIRANGTGRVIIDGAGTSEGSGNIYATDPLLTLNSAKTTSNTYDSGLIIERGTDINVGFIWDESADQFAFISTIEQGTVKGNVAITGYQDLSVGTVKLNSETASKVTFTDASKYVRSLDSGTTAYVDGVIKFNTGAQAAIPTGSTAQRPAAPQEGTIRYNTTVQQFEGYADSSWQAMGFGAGTAPSYQGFQANGSQFEFTLNQTPLSSAGIIVAINGVVQEPEIAYTVDNAILRFIDDTSTVVAPDSGDRIDVRFLSKPAVSTVRTSNFTGDDTTTAFDTGYTIASVETVLVFVNSIYQDSDVYSVSGRSVVFEEAPYQDDRVNIVNITTIVAPDLPTKTYVDQQITQVSNTATDDAIAFAIALG